MKKKIILFIFLFLTFLMSWCIMNKENKTDNWSFVKKTSKNDNYFSYFRECNKNLLGKEVKDGDVVVVDYFLEVEGKPKDTSVELLAKKYNIYLPQRSYEPLIFEIGKNQMIKGFEDTIKNMRVCDEKIVTVPPDKWYGLYNTGLVKYISMDTFKKANLSPEVGKVYNFWWYFGRVLDIENNKVKVDFNHELAWKNLKFYIKLLDIKNK